MALSFLWVNVSLFPRIVQFSLVTLLTLLTVIDPVQATQWDNNRGGSRCQDSRCLPSSKLFCSARGKKSFLMKRWGWWGGVFSYCGSAIFLWLEASTAQQDGRAGIIFHLYKPIYWDQQWTVNDLPKQSSGRVRIWTQVSWFQILELPMSWRKWGDRLLWLQGSPEK